MPPIVTPSQLHRRAEVYYQLGTLLGAGLGLPRALETVGRTRTTRVIRRGLAQIQAHLETGCTLAEAMERAGGFAPEFDVALLRAGEMSGRLDAAFRLLAEQYRERASMLRDAISDLLYPVFLFHAAVFLIPFAGAFQTGHWGAYLAQAFGILAVAYAGVFALITACQGRRGESWRWWLESLSWRIPVLGTARTAWSLARLSAALEALLSAGVNIIESWEFAAAASGSPHLRHRVASWRQSLSAGVSPAELVLQAPEFPELFGSQYQTAEISGKLDETLGRLHAYYRDEASRRFRALAQWLPRLVYILIALAIAYRVVSFYVDYFGQINQLLQ